MVFGALLCGLMCGCQEPAVDRLSTQVTLRYLPGCAPERVESLKLESLGDFAAGAIAPLALQFGEGAPARAAGLPFDAQEYRLSVETASFRGAALVPAGAADEQLDGLLLPIGQSCGVTDEVLPLLEGSALALADGRDLLLAGGAEGAGASRDLSVLSVASRGFASVAPGLFDERAGAVAVAVDGEVWILGGVRSVSPGSPAIDTFERYVHAERAVSGLGRMSAARVGAGALRLADGSVLVAGGRDAWVGAALDSLESITPGNREGGKPWSATFPQPLPEPTLRALDDGYVLALAALDEGPFVALIDARARELSELSPPPLLAGAQLAPQLTVALPGARAALFERDAGGTTGRLLLLLPDRSYWVLDDWLASFAGIRGAQSVALTDGRILLTGTRQDVPIARILDPGTREVAVRELDLAVERSLLRADGSVLLVGKGGARVLREDARSRFDNPGGTLLADDSGALCLDAYGRFVRSALSLTSSVSDARFDIAGLRYRDVGIELEVEGAALLLLRPEGGGERTIEVGSERVGPAFCQLSAAPGAPLGIERREQRITLRAGKNRRDCVLDAVTGPISLGLRALEPGVAIRDLRVQRR